MSKFVQKFVMPLMGVVLVLLLIVLSVYMVTKPRPQTLAEIVRKR